MLDLWSQRRRQPASAVAINRLNNITAGIKHVVVGSGGIIDVVSGGAATLDGGVSYAFGREGKCFVFDGSSTGLSIADSTSGAYSFFAVAKTNTTSGTRNIASIGWTTTGYAAQFRQDGSQWSLYHQAGSDKLAGESGTVVAGEIVRLAGTWDGLDVISFYRNGVKRASTTGVPTIRPVVALNVGQDNFGAKQAWDGDIYLLSYWNRALTEFEVSSLTVNPWQIFRPVYFNIPVDLVSSSAPTLTAASAINIGTTYATPRVTFTR